MDFLNKKGVEKEVIMQFIKCTGEWEGLGQAQFQGTAHKEHTINGAILDSANGAPLFQMLFMRLPV